MTAREVYALWLRLEQRDLFVEAGALASRIHPEFFWDVMDVDEIKRRAEQP